MDKRLRVLTLGWEFPPFYSGGLGTACYGLTRALSSHCAQTIILPKSDAAFTMKNVSILGIRKVYDYNAGQASTPINHSRVAEIWEIPASLSVYPVGITEEYAPDDAETNNTPGEKTVRLFREDNIYGPDIMKKVAAYADSVCSIAKNLTFDVIHAHDWITLPAAIRLKRLTGKPLFVHIHSLETDRVHINSRNAVYNIEKEGMECADVVFPVSNFTKDNIAQYYNVPKSKMHTVYNGIDALETEKHQQLKKQQRVLFLGRITAQKGPEYFIETARKLLDKINNVVFYIAGTGDKLEHTRWLVKTHGLEHHVVFTGFLDKEQVKDVLAQTDVYVMPSVSEPFGLSALEAAQYNIPCIISKQSGAAEVLPNTLQVDYWDTDKMTEYLYAALKYPSLRDTLTEHTNRQLPAINWEKAAEKVYNNYIGFLQTRRKQPALQLS